MIDSLISAVATVLQWILGVIADIAYGFSRLSYYAADIPGVGSTLASWFANIAGFFDDLYFDFRDFRTRVINVLNAIDVWLEDLADLMSDVYGWITDKLDIAFSRARDALGQVEDLVYEVANLWGAIPSPSEVLAWVMDKLGIYKKSGESWIQAMARTLLDYLASIDITTFDEIMTWVMNKLGIYKLSGESWWQAMTRKILEIIAEVDIPTFDEIMTWVMNKLGIYKLSGESWWQAMTRKILEIIAEVDIPTFNEILAWIMNHLGIYKKSWESWWDAMVRTIISSIPGLAGVVNFWNLFWEELNAFFSDPLGYILSRLTGIAKKYEQILLDIADKIGDALFGD